MECEDKESAYKRSNLERLRDDFDRCCGLFELWKEEKEACEQKVEEIEVIKANLPEVESCVKNTSQ
jgi:hypothetical protein